MSRLNVDSPSNQHHGHLPDFMTTTEVAELLRIGKNKPLGWILDGTLKASDVGGGSTPRWRIAKRDLMEFLRRRGSENMEI